MSSKVNDSSNPTLKKLLDKLEKRREALNKAAEEELLSGGDLGNIFAREEHAAFQQASKEYEAYIKKNREELSKTNAATAPTEKEHGKKDS